jgi:hypothetical protein
VKLRTVIRNAGLNSGLFIVLYVVGVHVGWAIAMMIDNRCYLVTPTNPYYALFDDYTRWVLLVISLIALSVETLCHKPIHKFLGLLPQQFLVAVAAFSSLNAILAGHYADGIQRSSHFIFLDQWNTVWLAVTHTFYVVSLLYYHLLDRKAYSRSLRASPTVVPESPRR